MSDLRVSVKRNIDAPIEQVFDAWLNPKTLSQFMQPMPGMVAPETEIDATVGGTFVIKMVVGDQVIPHTGSYQKIERPDTLEFSWQSPFSGEGSVVTLNFKSLNKNLTELNLTHVNFPDEESRSNHEGGWVNILELLNTVTRKTTTPA